MLAATSLGEVREVKEHPDLQIVSGLEEWCGADLMISPVSLPVTEKLLPKHLERGAVLVQIKRGHDIVSSIQDGRLHKSQSLMKSAGANSWQCILLYVGTLYNAEGQAVINGVKAHMASSSSYWTIRATFSKWIKRGGAIEEIPLVKMIPDWISMQERVLQDMIETPRKVFYPKRELHMPDTDDADDPLQELILIDDWRKTLNTFPGVGPTRIQALINAMTKNCPAQDITLFDTLVWLTTPQYVKNVYGISANICNQARAWMGLPEGHHLVSMPIPDEVLDIGNKDNK